MSMRHDRRASEAVAAPVLGIAALLGLRHELPSCWQEGPRERNLEAGPRGLASAVVSGTRRGCAIHVTRCEGHFVGFKLCRCCCRHANVEESGEEVSGPTSTTRLLARGTIIRELLRMN